MNELNDCYLNKKCYICKGFKGVILWSSKFLELMKCKNPEYCNTPGGVQKVTFALFLLVNGRKGNE